MKKKSKLKQFVLTDVRRGVFIPELSLTSAELGLRLARPWSVTKRRLCGGLADGVDVVEIDNGRMRVVVVPTRGMGIQEAVCDGVRLGWDSPVGGLVHPKFVEAGRRGGLGWLDGFGEWLCRCGLESNGAPCQDVIPDNQGRPQEVTLALHGRIANLPAERLELRALLRPPYTLTLSGEVREASMFGAAFSLVTELSTEPGSNAIRQTDTVKNLRAVPAEMELLYHVNYGPPVLGASSRLVAPVLEVVPRDARAAEGMADWDRFGAPQAGFVEQCYFLRLASGRDGKTAVLLRDARGSRGASLRWRSSELPCFTLWKNTAALADGYVTGLEPGTNYPNPRTFERSRGRVPVLAPGARRSFTMELACHTSKSEVTAAERAIRRIGGAKPVVHAAPEARFSPPGA